VNSVHGVAVLEPKSANSHQSNGGWQHIKATSYQSNGVWLGGVKVEREGRTKEESPFRKGRVFRCRKIERKETHVCLFWIKNEGKSIHVCLFCIKSQEKFFHAAVLGTKTLGSLCHAAVLGTKKQESLRHAAVLGTKNQDKVFHAAVLGTKSQQMRRGVIARLQTRKSPQCDPMRGRERELRRMENSEC